MEQADRIAAAADAGGDRVRQAAVFGQHLRARLAADHGVEVAHHARIRIRAGDGADDVEGVAHVGDPVAHRLVQRVLERRRTAGHRHHGRAEQLHAVDVDLLPLDVGGAHVDHAFQAQARGDGGAGDAVLAGAGLGDDPGLAHAAGEQRLADGVVDLVRAGVVQVLALEQDARAADFVAQALGFVDRARPADVMREVVVELGDEGRIDARGVVGRGQFLAAGRSGSRRRSGRRSGRNGRWRRGRRGNRSRSPRPCGSVTSLDPLAGCSAVPASSRVRRGSRRVALPRRMRACGRRP